jgi:hypothetical protein
LRTLAKGGWLETDELAVIIVVASSTRRLVRVVAAGRAMAADHHRDLAVRPRLQEAA